MNMPNQVETSSTNDQTGALFKAIENSFNANLNGPVWNGALGRVNAGWDGASENSGAGGRVDLADPETPVPHGQSRDMMDHFRTHWLDQNGSTSRYWPLIPAQTIRDGLRNAFGAALNRNPRRPIAIQWICNGTDPTKFSVACQQTDAQSTIVILTPPTPDTAGYAVNASTLDASWGPLASLCGHWYGDQGVDLAPDHNDPTNTAGVRTDYVDYQTFTPFASSGDPSVKCLEHHVMIWKQDDMGQMLHEDHSYWLWDGTTLTRSLTLPRGIVVLATADWVAGNEEGSGQFDMKALAHDIATRPPLAAVANPYQYTLGVKLMPAGNGARLEYTQSTAIALQNGVFNHVDTNTLHKIVVEPPIP
jgi:hypothetical protein